MTKEKIKELKILSYEIYALSCMLQRYCEYSDEKTEEIRNINEIVKFLHSNIDKMSAEFINIEL